MPTFPDFWKCLKEQPEEEAQHLAIALERYVTGNLNLFSHHSNVDLNNRLICFDVRDLGKQMKTLGMLICLDFIWNKITENREKGIRTWLYFDEFYLFFEDDYSANFFFELWKRARKWGAIPTGITQNVEDLLLSDTARRILSNTEFAMLLNQSATDRQEIAHIFNLAPRQLQYVTNSNEGEGLIIAGKSVVPFRDRFPSDTSIYKVLTTKFDEVYTTAQTQKKSQVS
jgi:type IV secretory pathway VirB4 component